MSFSIIIPSKCAANLVPCVKAIREAGETARIIVVDDGVEWKQFSGLPTPEMYSVPGVKEFCFSRNINIGIRAAGDDDVILLNDDALLRNHLGFSALRDACNVFPGYGCIGAVTNLTGQPLQLLHSIGLRTVPHIAFICVFIPRSTINLIGMLDERYNLDYGVEDRDYCEAINRAGLKVGVLDTCFVDHASLHSTFRGDPKAGGNFSRNLELFKQKWGIANP